MTELPDVWTINWLLPDICTEYSGDSRITRRYQKARTALTESGGSEAGPTLSQIGSCLIQLAFVIRAKKYQSPAESA